MRFSEIGLLFVVEGIVGYFKLGAKMGDSRSRRFIAKELIEGVSRESLNH